jgi:hypothetical protein
MKLAVNVWLVLSLIHNMQICSCKHSSGNIHGMKVALSEWHSGKIEVRN